MNPGGLTSLLPLVRAAEEEPEEDELAREPGLIGVFREESAGPFTQSPAYPSLRLGANERPDPRLHSREWQGNWGGVLEIRVPGKYRFSALSTGAINIQVNGKTVLSAQPGDGLTEGAEIELGFGLQAIQVQFNASKPESILKLYWQGETFPREPIPTHVLGHKQKLPVSQFASGWMNVEEHSCTACHQPNPKLEVTSSFKLRPGPRLSDAGARTKVGWIYHWLGNPQQLRPEAVMPKLFADDKRGQLERYAVAMYLSKQGKPRANPRNISPQEAENWSKEGRTHFVQSGCVVCHEKQGNNPARATLQYLGKKALPEDLADFIRNPAHTDPGGRMPGFNL